MKTKYNNLTKVLVVGLTILLVTFGIGTMMPRQRVRATPTSNEIFHLGDIEIRTYWVENMGMVTRVFNNRITSEFPNQDLMVAINLFRGRHETQFAHQVHYRYSMTMVVPRRYARYHSIYWQQGIFRWNQGFLPYPLNRDMEQTFTLLPYLGHLLTFGNSIYTLHVSVLDLATNVTVFYNYHFFASIDPRVVFFVEILGERFIQSARITPTLTIGAALNHLGEVPIRDNYIFKGWYYDSAFTQSVLATDAITADMIVYANMQPVANTGSETNDSGNSNNNAGSGSNSSNGSGDDDDDGDDFNFMYFIQNNPIAQYVLIGVGIFVLLSVGIPLLKSFIGGVKQ